MPLTYPDILKSNNPESYGIVPAKEVAGHKEVTNLEALYALAAPILSETYYTTEVKDASGNVIGIEEHDYENAIGQLWYVASEGKHYQLVDWANRKNANGWKEFKSGGSGAGHLVYKGCTFDSFGDLTEYVGSSDYTIQESETYTGYDNVTSLSVCFDSTLNCFYLDVVADGVNYIFFSWSGLTGIKDSREYGTSKEITVTNGTSTLTATVVMAGENIVYLGDDYKKFADGAMSSMSATDMAMDITNDELYRGDGEGGVSKLSRARVAYGTCDTAADVAEKVITLHEDFKDWKLEVGAEFVVVGNNANTAANPKLNVNGTGAKSVKYAGVVVTEAYTISYVITTRAVRYLYDGTNYVWMGWSYDDNTTYTPHSLGFGYGTCSTAATTAAKTATLASYTLVKNGIVSIKFTNSVPASATLNINSKGAKPIYYRGSAIVAGVINAGDVATFIYDGTNYIYLGTDNALSKAGGTMTGELVFDNPNDDNDSTTNDPFVTIAHDVIKLEHGMNDSDKTILTTKKVESPMIVKTGGTSDQVLLADGSVAGTITTDWLETNLT